MSSQASATTSGMKLNEIFRRTPAAMVQTMASNKRPKRCAPSRKWARLSPIGFVVLSCGLFQVISQSNCQMTPPTQTLATTNDQLSRHEADSSDELANNLPCNSQRRQQPALNSRSNQQRAMKQQQGNNQHFNPNHYSLAPNFRHNQMQQLGATTRQQRQFGQMLIRSANMLQAPEVQPASVPSHEEFSLSSTATSNSLPLEQNSQLTSTSNTGQNSTTNETVATASASIVSSTPPPNASNTITTEQAVPLNTTPMLATETIGSPVAPQPVATTTTASVPTAQSPSNSQRQQQGRRIEESSTLVVDRHSSSLNEDQAPGSKSNAISSLPSSTSIITPLINSATAQQQQQQSSSMIKPIYVVGNPIGDLDYSSTMYSEQLHQAADRQKADSLPASKPTGGSSVSSAYPQRAEKRLDSGPSTTTTQQAGDLQPTPTGNQMNNYTTEHQSEQRPTGSASEGDRMNGPALVYSGGHLVTGAEQQQQQQQQQMPSLNVTSNSQAAQTDASQLAASNLQPLPPLSPRLFQGPNGSGSQDLGAAAVQPGSQRRPSLPPPVNQANAASGLRSPLSPSGPLIGQPVGNPPPVSSGSLQQPANTNPQQQQQMANFYQTLPPYAGGAGSGHLFANGQLAGGSSLMQPSLLSNKQAFVLASQQQQQQLHQATQTANAIASQIQLPISAVQHQHQQPQASITNQQQALGPSRRPLNITRVEHISAECSNDLIRAVIVFNGTFKGMIYSSGYVNDPTCLYVNGTGLTRYEFSIRLNQCGTLGRQELHQPTIPGEARRRDQVMWNTLSIQYNPVIEQEWDEHFRVSCEYGSDFWKTISFNPFNVETSTGSPVVFTINPPQCQMDVLLGHGMGPKIAVDGPVTVGDPLTLLIHMKSEKAGYDILVKNCVAHNGGKQRMQLIDSNGCVVNERFISPFRGTYNDNDLRHVTLYAYLKAFRFTGSPVLYLECEIHMCQSACPPQMCYWRRLSKRSVDNNDFEYTDERSLTNLTATTTAQGDNDQELTRPVVSEGLSLFKALQVRHEPIEPARARLRAQQLQEIYAEDDEAQLVCYRHAEVLVFMATTGALLLLVLSVAVTCCLRIRKMTRSGQFKHSRMPQAGQSISPSSFSSSSSLDDAISSTRSSIGLFPPTSDSLLEQALRGYSPMVFAAPSNGKKRQQLLTTANISPSCDNRHHEQNPSTKRGYKNNSELASGTMPNNIFPLNR